jgi:RNA polymerase sigma factor (TIGR02999 family)
MDVEDHAITRILSELHQDPQGAREAANRLFEAVHGELRRMAGRLMRDERRNHTLQPTALVHEAYLRLVDTESVDWQSRAHFFGVAARAMRQILVDHAREHGAAKRGGGLRRVTLDERVGMAHADEFDLLDLDRILTRLAELDERMAQVVEYRVFAGMSVEEVAHVLGVSVRTVHNDWRVAKMWLGRELSAAP